MLNTSKAGPAPQVSAPARQHIGFKTMIAICVGTVVVQGAMASALMGFGIGGLSFWPPCWWPPCLPSATPCPSRNFR